MSSTSHLAENKLVILYLVDRMGIPLSNSEICQFSLERNLMDYFSVQQYLSELVESGFLDQSKDNNDTRYTVTKEGQHVLTYFMKHISPYYKTQVSDYITENGKRIQMEFEVTANYFPELNDDYLVKCGVYNSDGSNLMEISLSVTTKEQARMICSNWKKNVSTLYGTILADLVKEVKPEKEK